jgi:D-alanyl-D-alanine carboxypeptidase
MTDQPQAGGNESDAAQQDNYEVGYSKPPKATQFKPGNKFGKGRPKGAKNLATIVKEALGAKVSAKINGKTVKMTKVELAVHQLANKASSGDSKAIAKVVELYQQHGPQEQVVEVSEEESAYDLETIAHHLDMSGHFDTAKNGEEGDD